MAKKGVSKEDLKRLMKKMTSQGTIDHPLAKYNSLGHLICTVCNCQVKSDRLWNPHLLSRSHKERVSAPPAPTKLTDVSLLAQKRKHGDAQSHPHAKRYKDEVSRHKPKGILKNALPIASYSSDEESSTEGGDTALPTSNPLPSDQPSSSLPADFFDNAPTSSSATEGGRMEEKMEVKSTEELPEGFFDDPKADAKARNIEYVDKDELEWEKFQSEMKQESHISEQITAEDDFTNTEERHMEEIDEQLAQWSRVNNMLEKKEKLMKQKMETEVENIASSSDTEGDDLELDQFINWRSKKVMK